MPHLPLLFIILPLYNIFHKNSYLFSIILYAITNSKPNSKPPIRNPYTKFTRKLVGRALNRAHSLRLSRFARARRVRRGRGRRVVAVVAETRRRGFRRNVCGVISRGSVLAESAERFSASERSCCARTPSGKCQELVKKPESRGRQADNKAAIWSAKICWFNRRPSEMFTAMRTLMGMDISASLFSIVIV